MIALWLVLVGPLVQPLTAQSAPRLAMTGSIVDDRTLVIDGYPLGVDFATRDSHTYSDKAPGQALLSVPAYAVARAVGAEPAAVRRPYVNLTLWWVTLVTAGLPVLALVALMGAAIRRRGHTPTAGVLGAMCFGTLLLPLSASLYGHLLAAALGFVAWNVLDRAPPTARSGVVAGVLAGAAVMTEYQAAIVIVVLGTWLALRRRGRALVGLVLGSAPAAALLMVYLWLTTGSPLRTGYQTKTWEGESGFFTTHVNHLPNVGQMAEVLAGSRGLLLYTPIVAVGAVGLGRRWWASRDDAGLVGLAILGGFLLLQGSWSNTWAGEAPGPRYVVPALPFLAVGVAEVWGTLGKPVRLAVVGLSVTSMGLATVAEHLIPDGARLINWHLTVLRDQGAVPSIFTIALGPAGWVIHLGLAAAVALWSFGLPLVGTRRGVVPGQPVARETTAP